MTVNELKPGTIFFLIEGRYIKTNEEIRECGTENTYIRCVALDDGDVCYFAGSEQVSPIDLDKLMGEQKKPISKKLVEMRPGEYFTTSPNFSSIFEEMVFFVAKHESFNQTVLLAVNLGNNLPTIEFASVEGDKVFPYIEKSEIEVYPVTVRFQTGEYQY